MTWEWTIDFFCLTGFSFIDQNIGGIAEALLYRVHTGLANQNLHGTSHTPLPVLRHASDKCVQRLVDADSDRRRIHTYQDPRIRSAGNA